MSRETDPLWKALTALETDCECEDGIVACEVCKAEAEEAEVKHASSKWHRFHRYRGGELLKTAYFCPACNERGQGLQVVRFADLARDDAVVAGWRPEDRL